MSMQNYESALKLIEEAGGGDFEGAKSELLVSKAEAALGLIFPPTYRRFLLEKGCGDICGVEVFGLVNDNFESSSVPNGIWLTLNERRSMALSPTLVLVGECGDGTYLAIDTERCDSNGESPVVHLSIDGRSYKPVASSFGDFLLEEVTSALSR
jgi:hypothetical protein